MKQKRPAILIVSGFWPTVQNPITGIFVAQQVAAFVRYGFNVTIILAKVFGKDSQSFLDPEAIGLPSDRVNIIRINTLRLPEKLSGSIFSLRLNTCLVGARLSSVCKGLRKINVSFVGCLIHGSRYAQMSLPIWGKNIDTPILTVFHGVDPLLNKLSSKINAKSLMSHAVRYCQKVILVGSPLATYVKSLGVPNNLLTVVPNGVEFNMALQSGKAVHSPNGAIRILSISNLIKLKGIDHNILALARLSARLLDFKFEYHVIGDGPEMSNCRKLVSQLGLEEKVSFFGRMSYSDTMNKLDSADIFSLPSWGEAFGIVYLEAMSRGVPVIGCLNNGPEDIFQSGEEGFLIPPHNITELEHNLESLMCDASLRATMGAKGKVLAAKFTWDANVKRIVSLFDHRVRLPPGATGSTYGFGRSDLDVNS